MTPRARARSDSSPEPPLPYGAQPAALATSDAERRRSWVRSNRSVVCGRFGLTAAINRAIGGSQSDHGFVDAAAAALAEHDRR